ncbi:MAG: polysaccharide deacetylase family protein [Bacteroidia bacterium]
MKKLLPALVLSLFLLFSCAKEEYVGQTEITQWQYGKKAAVSLTYDDGTINQFRKALPLMDKLGFPATFYIITGNIPEATYNGTFIGRPTEEIIKETATIPTDPTNLFERASAIGFLGLKGSLAYHTQAGELVDQGKIEEACKVIDEAYQKVRTKAFEPAVAGKDDPTRDRLTWEEVRQVAANGHEFGSHTVTHPRLAVLDETNMLYELEKSKEEIIKQIGPEHTFSAECPYGTENERVMEYALNIYPSLRNRMPEPFLEEFNRDSKATPGTSDKAYVQWQRGPHTDTPMEMMKSWVDTILTHDNNWLVLVFHGVDGIGWQAKPIAEFEEYFGYMKEKESDLWIATFRDVTKYMREKMNTAIETANKDNNIRITLKSDLDPSMYNIPLTLKTYVPSGWEKITIAQGETRQSVTPEKDDTGNFVMYQANPSGGDVVIAESK